MAERILGPDGTVEWWGVTISDAEAALCLQQDLDLVVRGPARRESQQGT